MELAYSGSGPSFAESLPIGRAASRAELVGHRRPSKRLDRLAVAMRAEQHDDVRAAPPCCTSPGAKWDAVVGVLPVPPRFVAGAQCVSASTLWCTVLRLACLRS
jgi:hypothetical protein